MNLEDIRKKVSKKDKIFKELFGIERKDYRPHMRERKKPRLKAEQDILDRF